MTLHVTAATAARVLVQLRHDRRTVAMLLVVPCVLMALLRWVFDASPLVFDRIGLQLLGIFPFITMFLVTSVAMLRERTSGTLERLLTTPMGKGDLLAGYAVAFGVVALVQATVATALSFGLLGLSGSADVGWVVMLAVSTALLGMALGLLVSAFAATEFQAVQFMPAVVVPQLLLGGLLAPREDMALVLRWISDLLPLTYAVDGMAGLGRGAGLAGDLAVDLAVLFGATLVCVALAAATLRRRSA